VADHFCPGFIFYGGDGVRYPGVTPTIEIPGDASPAFPGRSSALYRAGDWFIHFREQGETPFATWLGDPRVEKYRLGDFTVGPVPPAAISAPGR
jgi:hypothetical protein